MNKHIVSAIGLSGLLLLGSVPGVVLAHEGHDHGEGRSGYSEREGSRRYEPQREERSRYRGEREESGRYAPQRDDDREDDAYDDDEEEDTYRSSSRRHPPLEREQSSPREQRGRPR